LFIIKSRTNTMTPRPRRGFFIVQIESMEKIKFILIIDAEKQFNILVRIIINFNRMRIPIIELSSHIRPGGDNLSVVLSIEETKERCLSSRENWIKK
jgi:hypothetical protein